MLGKVNNTINLIIGSTIIIMLAINIFIVYTYASLTSSHPLENIRGVVVEPINTTDPHLTFKGQFDRNVKCTLIDFTVLLINDETKDTLMLTKQHLAVSPDPDLGPGEGIDIKFALKTPKAIYAGVWQPQFTGLYNCSKGIFTDQKTVVVTANKFNVYGPGRPTTYWPYY